MSFSIFIIIQQVMPEDAWPAKSGSVPKTKQMYDFFLVLLVSGEKESEKWNK